MAIWVIVPTQVAAWVAWRLGGSLSLSTLEINYLRLFVFLVVGTFLLVLGLRGKLPRSERFYLPE